MPNISHKTDDMVLATWRNVVLWIGGGAATEEEIGKLHDALDAVVRTGAKPGLFMWLPQRSPIPTSAGRARASQLFRETGPKIASFAVVTEGGGFRASAIRSILTGINLATRQSFTFKAFPDLELAVPWLMEGLDMSSARVKFADTVNSLRDSVAHWGPPT